MQQQEKKLFGKWDTKDVKITDNSLAEYISLEPIIVPHTFGRRTRKRFEKAKVNIVERLINKIMRSGQGKKKLSGKFIRGKKACGQKLNAMKIVEKALDIVEQKTKQNPIQVLVKAIENSGPREDTTRIKRGGIIYTVSVDVSPMKRVDEALKNISLAAFASSFNNKKKVEEALANEIIDAAKGESSSYSIKRRDEIERIAKASR
ncbi:MAG: 30S ribosomal protein S7 [Candidatus Diapherotrites archaeon]|nr:30S ribosomal protein S7 [Candidatus Diapherotrites archaeon]